MNCVVFDILENMVNNYEKMKRLLNCIFKIKKKCQECYYLSKSVI